MSVLVIIGRKCTLAASHAAPWLVTRALKVRKKTGQTDGRTPDRYITPTAGRDKRNNV